MEENKNISATIRRAERFQVILIGEGIIVGGIGGLVVILYRMILGCAGDWLKLHNRTSAVDCRLVHGFGFNGAADSSTCLI